MGQKTQILTKEQIQQVIVQLTGVHRLIVQLLYGGGLRLTLAPRLHAARVQVWKACPVHSANAPGCQAKPKGMRLRVKDLDFGQRQILVRDAKGGKDRVTILPNSLIKPLRVQLATTKQLHEQDLADGSR